MSETQSRFLDRASQVSGEDIEKRYSAQSLLESQLSNDEKLMAEASGKMEASDGRPQWWGWAIPVALIVAGLLMVLVPAYHLYRMAGIIGGDSFMGMPIPSREYEPWTYYFHDLGKEERLLLFGDTDVPDEVGRREAFWHAEPENVGAYIEYLSAYRSEYSAYPEDMLETGKALDPDNAIFQLLHIGVVADDCTERVYPSRSRSRSTRRGRRGASVPTPPAAPAVARTHQAITDVELHREAVAMFHKVASMPMCNNYTKEMMQRRLPLLQRDGHDWVSRLLPVVYLSSQMTPSLPLMKVTDVIRAEAYRCEQEKDAAALQRLIADWLLYCRHLQRSGQSLIDGLVLRATIQSPCKDFAAAAKACGLGALEQYFTDLDTRMLDEKDARDEQAKLDDWGDGLIKEGGMLSAMGLPVLHKQVNDASAIPIPDTQPDRLSDHAFWGRMVSAVQWKLMLLCSLFAALWRYRSNGLIRKLGQRLACLFSWRDWTCVVCWGVLAPVGFYWLVNGTDTVMSVRRYNPGYTAMLMPAGQSAGLLLLLVLAPILAISHRLKKVLPLQVMPAPRMIWAAVILILVSIPLFGLVGVFDFGVQKNLMCVFSFQGMAMLLLLATPFVAMLRKPIEVQYSIAKAVRGQLIIKVYLLASVVMALQIPVYHAMEKHWVAENKLFDLNPEYTAFSTTESQVTEQLFKELGALLTVVNQDIKNVRPK
ncbi:MAG: hypothetical protein H7A51_10470 [Akkermansiaceae bacterium]|nr:hypothetical protein [Akkermansiaceae bacterium]